MISKDKLFNSTTNRLFDLLNIEFLILFSFIIVFKYFMTIITLLVV